MEEQNSVNDATPEGDDIPDTGDPHPSPLPEVDPIPPQVGDPIPPRPVPEPSPFPQPSPTIPPLGDPPIKPDIPRAGEGLEA